MGAQRRWDRILGAGACAAASLNALSPCTAQGGERPPAPATPATRTHEPPVPDGRFHVAFSGSSGSCIRRDANVGAAGACAEVTVGVLVLPAACPPAKASEYRSLRVGLEIGFGGEKEVTQGYADLGLQQRSGGWYGVVRVLLGYDLTPLFFMQVGAQLRSATESPRTGGEGLLELGTRVLSANVEIGARGQAGAEAIQNSLYGRSWSTSALAYGISGFLRFMVH